MDRDLTHDTEVLIAGAGPTGLVLALVLTRLGVRVRVIDKAATPGTTSRALVLHARTMEFYRQLGIADAVVKRSLRFAAVNLWVRGRRAARVAVEDIGAGQTAFPYMLIFPQDQHERLLIARLEDSGVTVERRTELLGFEPVDNGVRVRLRRADGPEEFCIAAYLAGCDGAHSKLREVLNAGFPGGTYSHVFYVADVSATGPAMNHELNIALDEVDLLGIFPMKGDRRARLIGTVREQRSAPAALSWQDVSTRVVERMRIHVERVNWFSTYHVHHRVATHFAFGRAFLVGDAGHIHSPVGGQGMNTGIGDAMNLGWKLAAVLRNRADVRLLETYEPERIAFARRLVATTDRGFTLATSPGRLARFVRLHVVARVLPPVFALQAMRRFLFRTVSQTAVNYRRSDLSVGRAGQVHAGDRLPWIPGARATDDNFASLTALDWQVHVYGETSAEFASFCASRGLALHTFVWRPAMARAGLARDAIYLVRPDGHVALANAKADTRAVEGYLEKWGLRRTTTTEEPAGQGPSDEPRAPLAESAARHSASGARGGAKSAGPRAA